VSAVAVSVTDTIASTGAVKGAMVSVVQVAITEADKKKLTGVEDVRLGQE